MYLAVILSLMVILPVASVLIEWAGGGLFLPLVAKWFVFWAVGVRLFVAGIRQVFQPSFTARSIFAIADPQAEKLVTEIGFGNLAMGFIACLTLAFPAWLVPAGLTGTLYIGLAGLKHVVNKNRSTNETIAMVSDLVIAAIVLVALLVR